MEIFNDFYKHVDKHYAIIRDDLVEEIRKKHNIPEVTQIEPADYFHDYLELAPKKCEAYVFSQYSNKQMNNVTTMEMNILYEVFLSRVEAEIIPALNPNNQKNN